MDRPADDRISRAQTGTGDMEPEEFRAAAHATADLAANYLARLESFDVLPRVVPGAIRERLPAAPPEAPEPLSAILADYVAWIEPNITHWQHPGFMAYFPSVASGPGILGEWLAATLNSNVMFWRNAPASTELEQVVVGWLRQMLGLPEAFDGMFTDTASVSSLLAILAARHAVPGIDATEAGLSGSPPLVAYASTEAHSSIEKAAIAAGIGRRGLRRIAVDADFRMLPSALADAIAADRASGQVPFCVVATLGTTSSTSVDPVAAIAEICERERLWLHVDAAYGGAAALAPELRPLFAGWERADSIVVNPHKWMFTPFDASLLLYRRPEAFRSAFCLTPEYLRASAQEGVHNYSEYGIQLGRRFRALKLWFMIRWFGTEGFGARIREHRRMALDLASRVAAEPGWELLAPVPFATVCFRYRCGGSESDADAINQAILDAVNRGGRYYLSATRLGERFALRVALGNPRAEMRHVDGVWQALRAAAALSAGR